MSKKLAALIGIMVLCGCMEPNKNTEESPEEIARRIHESVITLDTHNDFSLRNFTDSINYTQDLNTQVNLPKMKQGGLDVSWLIVYTGQGELSPEGYAKASENARAKFDAIHRLCERYAPDQIELALTSDDVRRIHASGKLVAMIGVENAYPMGEDLSQFEEYHRKGARYISLSHNGHSQFCDSNTGEDDQVWLHHGLSELGRQAISEMNRLGIMIDISHVSKESMMQLIELSRAPIIASHSSARALCNHTRNLDDEQLARIKENGGVVQTVAFRSYVKSDQTSYMDSLYTRIADSMEVNWYTRNQQRHLPADILKEFSEYRSSIVEQARAIAEKDPGYPSDATVADFVDHIDYLVEKMGLDHVGISSDFDGGGGVDGWSDASETFNVTLELVRRGYTEEEIARLWSGNLLRVLDQVQAVAEEIQSE